MGLKDLVPDIEVNVRGECPNCETQGRKVSAIEYRCTTSYDECDVLTWFEF